MASGKLKDIIPYYGDYKVRKQLDNIFSRKLLGVVLLGKFVGDYAAILATRNLGTDLGYTAGIIFIFVMFVYWETISDSAREGADRARDKKEDIEESIAKNKEEREKDDSN